MDSETQAQIDAVITQLKSQQQANIEAQKAQIKQEAQAELLAYLKSQVQIHFGI